jgi:hypothetical protein
MYLKQNTTGSGELIKKQKPQPHNLKHFIHFKNILKESFHLSNSLLVLII